MARNLWPNLRLAVIIVVRGGAYEEKAYLEDVSGTHGEIPPKNSCVIFKDSIDTSFTK